MTIERKVGMGIAGQPSGGAPDVAEVFSTYLYNGTGSTGHDIVNGIDLDGEGGLVWIKSRTNGFSHYLFDTEGGVTKYLNSTNTNGHGTDTTTLTHFNSTGFSLADSNGVNSGSNHFTSWTFRKKRKFFDVVTYSGNSTSGHTVSHSLGSVPAMMIIKQTNGTNSWFVYHKDFIKDGAAAPNSTLFLHLGSAQGNDVGDSNSNYFNNTAPTDSVFTLGSAGGDYGVNGSGENYVAYLFADNTAEDADDQMIKCGGFTDSNGGSVNLGWEPQWVMVRRIDVDSSSTSNGSRVSKNDWVIADTMRYMPVSDQVNGLLPNTSTAEEHDDFYIKPTSTGFDYSGVSYNGTGKFIYMAIRAPMMLEPEAGTDVFAAITYTGDGTYDRKIGGAGFAPDIVIGRAVNVSDNTRVGTRSTGFMATLNTNEIHGENATGAYATPDFMDGMQIRPSGDTNYLNYSSARNYVSWMLKRAKGFVDVVPYTGTGANATLPHSLGAVPEMMWIKHRSEDRSWYVYHKDTGASKYLKLDTNGTALTAGTNYFQQLTPTSTDFYVGGAGNTNGSGDGMIAYLFGSLDGISKVGSYTGTGGNINVDCGFSSGARLVILKRTDANHNWHIFDTTRGITASYDPFTWLDSAEAQDNSSDIIDPLSSGFIVSGGSSLINTSGGTYIFYAIA